MLHTINIYTASQCQGNPGPGGYAIIIDHNHRVQHLAGRDTSTTPRQVELLAVAEAIKAIPEGSAATIHLDSSDLFNLVTSTFPPQQTAQSWIAPGERNTPDHILWKDIIKESKGKSISWLNVQQTQANHHTRDCRNTALEQARRAQKDLVEIQLHSN